MRKAWVAVAIGIGALMTAALIVTFIALVAPVRTDTVVDRTSVANYTLKGTVLAQCQVSATAGSCSVSANGVTCTSPQLKAGDVFYAWPMGARERYRVRSHLSTFIGSGTETTSGYRYAFHPYANSIACGTS